jgi:uncharacterized integral membrane protein
MMEGPVPKANDGGLHLSAGTIAFVGGGGLLAVFMAQNTEDVTLEFLWLSFTWPVWLLCLIMAFVGAMVWFGAGVLRRHRRRIARRDARRD